jgi:hypothetical protein
LVLLNVGVNAMREVRTRPSSSPRMSTGLTDLEGAVLKALLEGSHPVLDALRRQLRTCDAQRREFTGYGFFTELRVQPDERPAPMPSERLRLGDVEAHIPGLEHGAGFLLYVDRGFLTMLEGYSYDEPWPVEVNNFTLEYAGGVRDVAALHLDEDRND